MSQDPTQDPNVAEEETGMRLMKRSGSRRVTALTLFVMLSVLWPSISLAGNPWDRPSGWHYNLQLIAVPKGKTFDGSDSQGRRIFIKLEGNTKILLSPGPFQVLDFNGTDGEAKFQMPANPCVDASGTVIDCPVDSPTFQCYSVWIAELGKPCKASDPNSTCSAVMELCGGLNQTCDSGLCSGSQLACTVDSDCQVCSLEPVLLKRDTGRPKWRDVTKQLTTLCLDLNSTGQCDTRIPLFDEDFLDFFWSIDNSGLRHAQIRFYPEPGDVCGVK